MPTLRDVADKAGVTYSSVSKIINGGKEDSFAPGTVQKVRDAARTLGYAINHSARSLKTGRTGIIGISSATRRSTIGFKDPYLNDIYTGINNHFIETDYKLIFEHWSQIEDLDTLCRDASRGVVDGIIFVLFAGEVAPFMRHQAPYLAERNFPFVVVHSLPDGYPFPHVGFQSDDAAYRGCVHLLDHGYDRLGFIDHQRPNPLSDCLYRGYVRALADRGMEPDPALRIRARNFTVDAGRAAAAELLAAERPLPRAFFTAEQGVATGMIGELTRRGVRVPEEAAFVCLGHEVNDQVSISTLTTVENCGYEKGKEAARLLAAQLERRAGNTAHTVEPRLTVRTSCGCPENPLPAPGHSALY